MNLRRQAVALEYGQNSAPIVSAKGDDELALDMLAQARRHGVFITQDPQLLALLGKLQLDQEIPPELYDAVAAVLSWAYWLRGMRPGDEKTPPASPERAQAQASL